MKAQKLIHDFEHSLERFKEALNVPAANDLIRAGCIQYFEFCFELSWKSIKVICEDQGLRGCNSPKNCFKQAFTNGWINEEDVWLGMLTARNIMSHTYDAEEALKVYNSLDEYCIAMMKLLGELKKLV